MPQKLITEMGRITNKTIVIVTHGKPANRCPLIDQALSVYGQWEGKPIQCELSFQAQFINIVRSSYPGESLVSVIKNPEKFSSCLKEIAKYKESQETSEGYL